MSDDTARTGPRITEEQRIYARVLNIGMYTGLGLLLLTFALYVTGLMEPAVPIDNHFLAALEAGLPNCSGVALGLDRLLMIGTGAGHIDEVLAFPVERA